MVVVFGSINLDLIAQVARMPLPGETLAGTSFSTSPGGKGANQALAARRAGANVRMFGAVGRDAFAASALANMEAGGVDLAGVVDLDRSTGVALIHIDTRGENTITVVAGANGDARAAQVPDDALGPDATLVFQLEVPLGEIEALVRRARSSRIILNAAPAVPLSDALLHQLSVLVVNETEAAAMSEALKIASEPEAFARAVAAQFHCTVVVTLGSRGALAVHADEFLEISAPRTQVVDTTGAGDALVGALAAALDRGASLRVALAEGVAAGSLACAGLGAQDVLPARDAIQALAATL